MRNDLKQRLQTIEARVRELREQKAAATKIYEALRGSSGNAAGLPAAREGISGVDAKLSAAEEEAQTLLTQLGDAERGMSGEAASRLGTGTANGWQEVATKLDVSGGVNRADVAAASLLRAQVEGPSPKSGYGLRPQQLPSASTEPSPIPSGPYYAYQAFPREDAGGAASVTDFTITFTSATVTGMERAPAAVTNKPALPATYALATPDVRQHAILNEDVPLRLLDSRAFSSFLDVEARRQVDLSVDRHVLAQLDAANPPSGSSGTGLIAKIRNAVAASRAFGSWPSVILLPPNDSSALDLSTTGADGMYVFPLRDTGSSSPLWSLRVIESAAVTNPLLLDPGRLGVLYVGAGSVTVDDLSGLKQNTARIRTEVEALLHVRCAQAAYEIA